MCVGYTLIYAILYKGPGTNPQRMQRDDCINFSKVVMVCVLVSQSSPTLCNPIDCSLPGSSVHGILQGRTQEWVVMPRD